MSHRIVLRSKAERAIDRATDWYDRRNPDAASAFMDAIAVTLNRIAENPYQFPKVRRKLFRAVVRKSPYSILFRLRETEAVIVTCVHFRQDEKRWGAG